MAEHGVYRIRNLINGKCYVGSAAGSKGFVGRWSEHRRDANQQRHHSIIFQRAWNKYGVDMFVFEIIELCLPIQCLTREQYWLDQLQPEYNVAKKAGSVFGLRWTLSQATRQKMSIAFRGRKHSIDSKARMSQNSKGKTAGEKNGRAKLNQVNVDNIRDQHTGRHGQLSQLARQYDVNVTTIKRIIDGVSWGSI